MKVRTCENCLYLNASMTEDHCVHCIDCSNWKPEIKIDKKNDNVNHPHHYTFGQIEVLDVIEDWKLDYHRGNAVKYIARAPHKGKFIEDLKKAVFYINRKIKLLEADNE